MPKIVDHDQQRERLLDATFELMATEGYAGATMRRIARAAGVSTGTLYHYFPDKPAILSAMFALVTDRDAARVRSTLPPDAPVELRIRALFTFVREHRAYLEALLRLVLEVHRHEPDEASSAAVREASRRYQGAVAEVLGIDALLVQAAFALLVGNLVLGVLDPDGVDLDGQERLVLAVWRQLGPG